jgi:hypothetical protein
MNRTRRVLVALVVVVEFAGVLWLLQRGDAVETRVEEVDAPQSRRASAPPRERGVLELAPMVESSTAAARDSDSKSGESPSERADASIRPLPPPRWLLQGNIQGSREDLSVAKVCVRPVWWDIADTQSGGSAPGLTVHPDSSGFFELDVSSLVNDSVHTVRSLLVTMEHSALQCPPARVAVPPLGNSRERLIRLLVVLNGQWGSATIRGRVFAPDGNDQVIRVGAYKCDSPTMSSAAAAAARTDRLGSFELEVPAPAEYAIAALIGELRPGTGRVRVQVGDVFDAPPIVISSGESIRGRLIAAEHLDPRGASVNCQPAHTESFVTLSTTMLAWCGDAFELREQSAQVDENGWFEFHNLGKREYELDVSSWVDSWGSRIAWRARAPSLDPQVRLPEVCEIRLSFFVEGQPAKSGYTLEQTWERGGRSMSTESDETGHANFFMDPSARLTLRVVPKHGPERIIPVEACSTGHPREMRIDL